MNPYHALFQALNDAGIRYLVVGGMAVNLHGYSRFTGDVDILLALDSGNLDRMGTLMERQGFTQRLPIDIHVLSDQKQVQKFLTEKGMTAYSFVHPKLPQISVDVLAGESLNFETYDAHKAVIEAWTIPIPVISVDDLIELKRKANRQKDIDDIEALLQLKQI